MFKKIGGAKIFAQMFNIGLLFLFAGLLKEYFFAGEQKDFFQTGMFSFFALGATLCLISLIFLFAEWVMLPFGTQNKRAALYRGAGNLLALAILGGSYLSIANQLPQNSANALPLTFASSGIFVAAVFAFLGKPIANQLCRKKINSKLLIARNLPNRTDAAKIYQKNRNIQPLKIQKFLSEVK